MTLAKPLAAGLPMGAVLMNDKVHQALAAGDHGSTFAGGALVSAVALHVLERISAPHFLHHVQEVGSYLWERLSELHSPHILEVRGRGLMLGLELDIPVAQVVAKGYEHGLLLVGAGPNTLRLIPPLIITTSEIDMVIDRLTQLFAAL
jgi:acetylornithine/succinyldiaminopimelate/putrescine aminotransferase